MGWLLKWAVSTFIRGRGGGHSIPFLPVGILDEVNVDFTREQLEDEDMIVMMTVAIGINPFREDKKSGLWRSWLV